MNICVSVVVAVFNGEKTIKRCIDSLLKQTLKEIEVIVVNDGSTDGTVRVLSEYGEAIIVLTQPQSGQGIARNRGMAAAKGAYIGFVDADDEAASDMYGALYRNACETGADLVQCNLLHIKSGGSTKEAISAEDHVVQITDKADYFRRYVNTFQHSMECCNKLFKASFLNEHSLIFESNEKIYAEDLRFNLQSILYLQKISFVNKAFYRYYIAANSHSRRQSPEKVKKLYRLFSEFSAQITDKALFDEVSKLAILIIFINLAQVIVRTDGEAVSRMLFSQKAMKRFLIGARHSLRKPHQKIIMLMLLLLPQRMKNKLIKVYYRNMRT